MRAGPNSPDAFRSGEQFQDVFAVCVDLAQELLKLLVDPSHSMAIRVLRRASAGTAFVDPEENVLHRLGTSLCRRFIESDEWIEGNMSFSDCGRPKERLAIFVVPKLQMTSPRDKSRKISRGCLSFFRCSMMLSFYRWLWPSKPLHVCTKGGSDDFISSDSRALGSVR